MTRSSIKIERITHRPEAEIEIIEDIDDNQKRAINLLQKQFQNVHVRYLDENTVFSQKDTQLNKILNEKFIFLIQFDNKWFTLTNISPNGTNTEWKIYDSLNDLNNMLSIQHILEKLTPNRTQKIEFVRVQETFGQNDCHFFALTYAITLLNNKNPQNIKFEQVRMGQDFDQFLRANHLSEFKGIIDVNVEQTKGFNFLVN